MKSVHRRINSGTTGTPTTTNFIKVDAVFDQINFLCSAAGTSWTLTVKDKAGTPAFLYGPVTLIVPTDGAPITKFWDKPLTAEGGIDVITAGTLAGVADVWISCAPIQSNPSP